MAEKLTADELGEVGEKLFGKLCAQAKLICNPSGRDRTGWDFRVEFPMSTEGPTLDQREPRACQIQLKCTAGETGTVRARLSAMEHLAKEKGPAALVVFRLRPDGSELTGYMVHLVDKELAKILHRLRVAEHQGRTDINKLWISFDYRNGRRFKLDANGLQEALAEICPTDVDAYVSEKRRQFENLGYEDGRRIEGEALIYIESGDHFTRLVSGLAPLKPLELRAYDRRFGLRVPYRGDLLDGIQEFQIDLPRAGPATFVIRGGPLRPAALFQCEAFVPLPVPNGPLMAFRHPAMNLLFFDRGFEFESSATVTLDRYELANWVQLLRGLSYLAEGTATIDLEFRESRLSNIRLEDGLTGPYLDDLPVLLTFVDRLQHALDLAGVAAPAAFSLDDIWAAKSEQMALDVMFNSQTATRFEFDAIDGVVDEDRVEAIYFNTVEFSGAGLTFATRVTLERMTGSTEFRSTSFELLDLRAAVADRDAYGAQLAVDHDIVVVIHPDNVTMTDPVVAEK